MILPKQKLPVPRRPIHQFTKSKPRSREVADSHPVAGEDAPKEMEGVDVKKHS